MPPTRCSSGFQSGRPRYHQNYEEEAEYFYPPGDGKKRAREEEGVAGEQKKRERIFNNDRIRKSSETTPEDTPRDKSSSDIKSNELKLSPDDPVKFGEWPEDKLCRDVKSNSDDVAAKIKEYIHKHYGDSGKLRESGLRFAKKNLLADLDTISTSASVLGAAIKQLYYWSDYGQSGLGVYTPPGKHAKPFRLTYRGILNSFMEETRSEDLKVQAQYKTNLWEAIKPYYKKDRPTPMQASQYFCLKKLEKLKGTVPQLFVGMHEALNTKTQLPVKEGSISVSDVWNVFWIITKKPT